MLAQRYPTYCPHLPVLAHRASGRRSICALAMVGARESPTVRILDPDNYKARVGEAEGLLLYSV